MFAASIIALVMEASNTSETSPDFYNTKWSNTTGDSHLHSCRRKKMKLHKSRIDQKVTVRSLLYVKN
jgi:hypothetical protein